MIAYYQSPIGVLEIEETECCISAIRILSDIHLIKKGTSSTLLNEAIKQLDEYFNGKRTLFDLPLYQEGTAFQKRAWDYLLDIPYGETRSYQDEAKAIGSPNGYRAAGSANGKNHIPIIIPCHRIINNNGKLGGYAYGLEIKQWLLNMEALYKESEMKNQI